MNMEFLQQMGLSEEVINEIMAEHERNLGELRAELEGQLSAKDEELKELRTGYAIDMELAGLGAKNFTAVKALLDMDNLDLEAGVEGLKEQLEQIRRENDYLFADPQTPVVVGPTAPKTEKGFGFKFTGVR